MYLDSKELIEKRDELKEQILNDFNETFPQYETDDFKNILFEEEEIQSWKEDWLYQIVEITDIDSLEEEVSSSEWEYGMIFISEDEFEDYCKQLVEDCGYLSSELPFFISSNIDWTGVADDLRVDYSEVAFQGENYLFRE